MAWFRRGGTEAHGKVEESRLSRIVSLWQKNRPLPQAGDYAKFANEGYRYNLIVHACVKEIARSAAEPDLVCESIRGNGEPTRLPETHDLVRLLARPNPEQSQFELLERLVIHQQVSGNAYLHKVRDNAHRVRELWTLRPDRVRIVPGDQGRIARYEYKVGETWNAVPTEDVIHFPLPDPLDDYYGLSPLVPAARAIDLDNNAYDFLRAFFLNAGTPHGILKLKQKASKEQRALLKQLWKEEHAGLSGWHNLSVLDQDADYQTIGAGPDKLSLGPIFEESEARICAALGVPPIIVGTRLGLLRSTMANYEAAVRQLWQQTLKPTYTRIGDKLSLNLANEYGDDVWIRFDLDAIEALQESQDMKRKWAIDGWNAGLMTKNEARKVVGMEDAVGGDVFKVSQPAPALPKPNDPPKLAAVN